MSKTGKKVAIGALIAAAGGYVAGVLTAPKSGKETRSDIGKAAQKTKEDAEKKLKALHSELDKLIAQSRTTSKTLKATAQKELAAAITKAQTAKNKAREILSAFHEGEAEDQDLKTAVTDAKQAAEHLKKYLKKTVAK